MIGETGDIYERPNPLTLCIADCNPGLSSDKANMGLVYKPIEYERVVVVMEVFYEFFFE